MQLNQYSLKNILPGERVLMRVDLNVLLNHGKIEPEARFKIKAIVPEVKSLCQRGARVILMSHLGRPAGKRKGEASLKSVANVLSREMKSPIIFSKEIVGDSVISKINQMKNGQVMLLENLRFNPGEESNQLSFAKQLSELGDIYINNAFSVSHRKHASMVAITKYLPSYAGLMLSHEVKELSRELPRPLVLLLGGIKIETKIDLIKNLLPKAKYALIGGGLAVSFLSLIDKKSLYAGSVKIDEIDLRLAKEALKAGKTKIILPVDFKVSKSATGAALKLKAAKDLNDGDKVFDIGPKTVEFFAKKMQGAKSLVWNGAVGDIEKVSSSSGTIGVLKAMAKLKGTRKITGGGETIAFVDKYKLLSKFDFVSLGGGAMLTFLAGKPMPGLKVIRKK